MKKALLIAATLIASAFAATAQDQPAETQAWYKTWLTPTDCRTGLATIQYDELDDVFTVPTGLAGDADYQFKFKFVPGDSTKLLSIWYRWDNTWVSKSDWTFVQYTPQYQAAIDAGEYYWLVGDLASEGSLYIPQLAYDLDDSENYSAINYYHTASLIWPYVEPIATCKGTYHNGYENKDYECTLEKYEGGEFVIKAINGINGYDLVFADSSFGNLIYFDANAGWYNPEDYPDYQFYVFTRMACSKEDGLAMQVTKVNNDTNNGKAEFTYYLTTMSGWNGATYSPGMECVDTFTWNPSEVGISTNVADSKIAPTEMYNLQGQRVSNPQNGVFIKKQGDKTTKVVIR